MKKLSTTLLATALIGVISLGAVASVSAANNNQFRGGQHTRDGAGFVHFVCNDDSATRIETGLTRMAERLELTDEQTVTFDALKTSALEAQASFSEICTDVKSTSADAEIDMIGRLENRQAMMGAQLTAMSDILPELKTFIDSLTDEQKAQMRPDRSDGQHRHGPRGGNGQHEHQNGNNSDNG